MQLFGRTGVNLVIQFLPQRMVRRKDHTVCLVYPLRSVKASSEGLAHKANFQIFRKR